MRTGFAEVNSLTMPPPCLRASEQTSQRESAQRARFEAVRQRVFDEMGRGSARWRLTWILPFHVLVVGILFSRGESMSRVLVQGACVAAIACFFVARLVHDNRKLGIASFVVGLTSYFVLCATTGGLASPLLVILGLMICISALSMQRPAWLRPFFFVFLASGFVGLAALSCTSLGKLVGPLAPTSAGPSPVHICIAFSASLFTMIGVYRMGWTMSCGYERAALELAERREELCTENEDRSRALEGMAARLAHEVKNPLAAIKGLSVHMARNASDAKTAERLAIVAAEADRLQSIVDGFLSFSRGLDDLNLGPTRPHEVARELAVLLETRAQDAGVSIETAGDADLVVDADARKLRQALLNIVLNAIQASPRGSGVHIAVIRDCEGARLTVRDEGVGMTPDVLERIRKPYFTTKEGGTGLGLAVARGLIEQHGGRLEFKSAPRTGTTVTLILPAKAKHSTRLPYPVRAMKSGGEAGGDVPSEAAVAGAR
jgi:signal transduction histidine kinase